MTRLKLFFISFGNTRILPLIDNINICPPGAIIKFNKKLGSTNLLFKYKIKPKNLNKLNNFQLLEKYKKIFFNSISKNQINKKKIKLIQHVSLLVTIIFLTH